MPVGFFEHAPYEDAVEQLQPGDVLVIYSDGVTEALDIHGQEFGEERLIALIREHHTGEASAILERIIEAVQTFARGARAARRRDGACAQVCRVALPDAAALALWAAFAFVTWNVVFDRHVYRRRASNSPSSRSSASSGESRVSSIDAAFEPRLGAAADARPCGAAPS